MTVTDIREYKVKGRFEIYLNDEFAFLLYKGELKKYNIVIGQELSLETYTDIFENVLIKRGKKRALNLLLKGDLPEKKLREKLAENLYPKECIEEIITYVKGYNYIDDARYARNYIGMNSSVKSRQVIRNKLLEKGISKEIIDEQIRLYYEEDELNTGVEEKLLKKLLQKKLKGNYDVSYEEKQKIYASLYRKGFSISKIEKVYCEYTNI